MQKIKIEIVDLIDPYYPYPIGDNHSFPEFVDLEELKNDAKTICKMINEHYKKILSAQAQSGSKDPRWIEFGTGLFCKNNCGVYLYTPSSLDNYFLFKDNVLQFLYAGYKENFSPFSVKQHFDTLAFIRNSTCEEMLMRRVIL